MFFFLSLSITGRRFRYDSRSLCGCDGGLAAQYSGIVLVALLSNEFFIFGDV